VFEKLPLPGRQVAVFKSLPALGHDNDPLDEELQQLSDSLGVLYQHEQSEMEFLDTFMDYDDISIIYKSCEEHNNREDIVAKDSPEDQIVVVTDKNEEITHEILINGTEETSPRSNYRDGLKLNINIAERIKWLRSRGRLMLRNLSCKCKCNSSKEINKENTELEPDKTIYTKVEKDGHFSNLYSKINLGKKTKNKYLAQKKNLQDDENRNETSEEKSLIIVKCFNIEQKQAQLATLENKGYDKVLTDLENLEKLILKDTVRETFLRQREMETIAEEVHDLSFSNLSYDQVLFQNPPQNHYENIENKQPFYENIKTLEKSTKEPFQHYENVPTSSKTFHNQEDNGEYESYDFGEQGIYQNIVFSKGSSSAAHNNGNDITTKVDALQQCINEVNSIIKSKNNINEADRGATSDNVKYTEIMKPNANKNNKNSASNFRAWALGYTEHPKIDISKLTKTNSNTEVFSQEEKNVVSDFLKSFKNELKF